MLKKVLFIIFCFFLITASAYCYSEENLSSLEYQRYGESYEYESLSSRLSRLENDLFGMTQSGDVDKRIEMIVRMSESNNIVNVPHSREDDFEKRKNGGSIKKFWNNFTSALTDTGTMTGFIPPMYGSYGSYGGYYPNGYNNYYGNNRFKNRLKNRFYTYGFNGNYPPPRLYNHYGESHSPHCCRHHNFGHHGFIPNNTVSYPTIYPNSYPVVPTESYNNYFTSSTVRILND